MHEPKQHVSPITNWKQLVVVVALAFIVPIAVIILLTQYVTDAPVQANENDSAVLNRIKPVGEVLLATAGGSATQDVAGAKAASPASVTTAAAPAAAAAAPAGKVDGKKTYDATCSVCHGAGIAGAPKFGDKAAWAPRLKTGIDTLYASAIKGKAGMPAKGGNPSLSDPDVKAAVDYMAAAAK
jgi:cytochrome c5